MTIGKNSILLTACLLLLSQEMVAQLQANFTTDKTGGCSPIAIVFTNTTSGASADATYQWDFGNGNTSASFNAGAVYKDEKDYTVTLTVQEDGKVSVKSKTISVYAKPVVNDFTVSPVKGCLPVNTTFTATAAPGSGSLTGYLWDFGDGNTQQGFSASQQHIYSVAQKATVSLTVTNSFGCTNTLQKKDIVEIIPSIGASFIASQTILCRETDAVQFINNSFGPGVLSYLWDFGDGTTSTAKAPSHSFNKKGIYTVTLTVTSSEGCVISSRQAGYINVASFSSDFSVPPLICKGSYVTFNGNSTPYTNTSNWEVDGAPAYYYSSYFNYAFNTIGSHTIKLKNIFGTCPDSAVKTISVKDVPYPNGFLDTILSNCGAPAAVHFKDTTAGAVKWEWNFNSNYNYNAIDAVTQSAAYTYTSDGGYYALLKVTNADGCFASTSKYIGITRSHAYITANGTTADCGPIKLTFTATSPDQITSYSWNFGDASYSTAQQPEHLFSNPGNYSVTLTYTNSYGCTETVSYGVVRVYGKPTADFTASSTTICGNTPVLFTAVQPASEINYYWYFGDSNYPEYDYSTGGTSHQYNYDSAYTVTLIVSNGGGCRDTVTKKDYIKILPPFPHIASSTNTCDGTRGLVTFTQDSKKGETFNWDFGDGNTLALPNDQPSVAHLYTKSGYYNVVLTVTNGQCTLKTNGRAYVLLKQNPVFITDRSEACSSENFGYQVTNIEPNPYQVTYQNSYSFVKWQYDDGTDFKGNINYNYYDYWLTNTSGTAVSNSNVPAKIRVIFKSAVFGCSDTTNYVPIKFKGAIAGFEVTADKQCWRQPVIFNDTSKAIGSSQIIRRDWNFGDGVFQSYTTGGQVTHHYNNPGTYYVNLTITDAGGCVSSVSSSKYVEVYGPRAAFYPSTNNTTITLPVYFYNNTNNYNSNNTQYQWSFGDGVTSTDYYPSHAYTNPGQYTVTLVALNPSTLCSDTVSQTIKVLNFAPAFTLNSTVVTGKCPPVLVRFINNSINYTSVTWDFGDGITADNLNYPSHVYEKPGKYIVTLYVYGVSGLKATYTDSVIVKLPAAVLRTDTSDVCIGGKANLSASLSNAQTYLWDFGDGNLSAFTDSNMAHIYNTAGVYKPAIIVTDVNGCSTLTPLSVNINVHPNPVINFSPAQPVVCKGGSLQINASGGSVYEWTPSSGLNNSAIASPIASPDVNTVYTVSVKDNIGCTNKAVLNVTVAQPFTLKAPPDAAICYGKSIQLPVTGASSYNWINNTTGLSNTQSADPVALPLTTTSYTVRGTDQYNCFTDTAQVTVKVFPLPVVIAGPDQEVQLATPVQLTAQTDNDIIKWHWSPSNYLNCPDCSSPVSTPLAQTAYTVSVTNKNGCVASDTIVIKVQCEESTVRIPNAFTPNNDGNNDVFMIKGISIIKHLVIFGRWGEKVFERSNFIAGDRSSCWDGTYKGNPSTAGSYVYYAEMQCPSGGEFMLKGSVVLIR
ncbi:MAG: PKD domain-containing protein [Bacteroidota bacterium]